MQTNVKAAQVKSVTKFVKPVSVSNVIAEVPDVLLRPFINHRECLVVCETLSKTQPTVDWVPTTLAGCMLD